MILLNVINVIVKFREQETTSNYFVAYFSVNYSVMRSVHSDHILAQALRSERVNI